METVNGASEKPEPPDLQKTFGPGDWNLVDLNRFFIIRRERLMNWQLLQVFGVGFLIWHLSQDFVMSGIWMVSQFVLVEILIERIKK